MRQPRPVRRKDRVLDIRQTMEILENGLHGVLATADAEGLPLATPLSYVILGQGLYFHCAKTGHKLDNLAAQPQVSFCVVAQDVPTFKGEAVGNFTTLYKSAVVNGTAALVDDPAEHRAALMALCQKYLPDHVGKAEAAIDGSGPHTAVVRISLDEVCGKSNVAAG